MEDSEALKLATSLDKVRHQASSTLVHQNRPAKLLEAIEATLTEQGTALTPIAYFAGLLSTTQRLLDSQSQLEPTTDQDGETLPAALYLLAIVAPCTQHAVIRSKTGSLLEVLCLCFSSQADQAGSLKSIFTILQAVYLAMDGSTLSSLTSKKTFNTLLPFTIDPRPKVRRKAQDSIIALLANPPAPSVKHPYATRTADFVVENLKGAIQEGKKGSKRKVQDGNNTLQGGGAASGSVTKALALCGFIKGIGKDWPVDVSPQK